MKTKAAGESIKYYRKKIGMTQKQLAKILGYNDARVVHQIEKGAMKPPLNKVRRLSRALFISPSVVAVALLEDFRNYLHENIK